MWLQVGAVVWDALVESERSVCEMVIVWGGASVFMSTHHVYRAGRTTLGWSVRRHGGMALDFVGMLGPCWACIAV